MLELVALVIAGAAIFGIAGLAVKSVTARVLIGAAVLSVLFLYLRQPLLLLIVVAGAICYLVYLAKTETNWS